MKRYDKILFVSHSDTCRGPMAEAIMQSKLLLEDILIASKGMIVLFPEPVNPKALEVLRLRGYEMPEHEAEPVSVHDFDERTLILTMDQIQKDKLIEEYQDKAINLYTLAEYSGVEGDIYNPIGKDLPEYGHCFDILELVISRVVTIIKKEEEES